VAVVVDEARNQRPSRETFSFGGGTDLHDTSSVLHCNPEAAVCPACVEDEIRDQGTYHYVRGEAV
jgi:hypothetical protein